MQIAAAVDRPPSTIPRGLKRNTGEQDCRNRWYVCRSSSVKLPGGSIVAGDIVAVLGPTVEEVEAYLNQNREGYLKLLATIRNACGVAEERLGAGVIRDVYGRAEKQAHLPDRDFKAPAKIAKAAARLQSGRIGDVKDIIGLTVVVYYPNQFAEVEDLVRGVLHRQRIKRESRDPKKDRGYFATHLLFKSDHTDHRDLYCELQIKTMLHDAWAAKTHDLTYKPQGLYDTRLSQMMNLFAESLQGIEVLSETLRDMIQERWAAEDHWRRSLGRLIFSAVPTWSEKSLSNKGQKLREKLINGAAKWPRPRRDSPAVQRIAAAIDDLAEESAHDAYVLDGYLAMWTDHEADRIRAERRALKWLSRAREDLSTGKARDHDIWSVPLILKACGNLEQAIATSERILSQNLNEKISIIVAFNLANLLTERACFELPETAAERAALEDEIKRLVVSADRLREHDPTVFYDLEGMIDVAFSTDSAILCEAIKKIERGNVDVPPEEAEAAKAYYDVHIRLAWRRLLDAESREALSSGRK